MNTSHLETKKCLWGSRGHWIRWIITIRGRNDVVIGVTRKLPVLSLDLLHQNGETHIDTAPIGSVPEKEAFKHCPQLGALWPGTFNIACYRLSWNR